MDRFELYRRGHREVVGRKGANFCGEIGSRLAVIPIFTRAILLTAIRGPLDGVNGESEAVSRIRVSDEAYKVRLAIALWIDEIWFEGKLKTQSDRHVCQAQPNRKPEDASRTHLQFIFATPTAMDVDENKDIQPRVNSKRLVNFVGKHVRLPCRLNQVRLRPSFHAASFKKHVERRCRKTT